MTCAEFEKLYREIPFATRGERAAAFKHHDECPACNALVAKLMKEKLPRLTPLDRILSYQEAGRIAEADMADPEFMKTAGRRYAK